MRITIAGCGALGSVFAEGLLQTGADLQVYQRQGATFDALQRQGGIKIRHLGNGKDLLVPIKRISDRAEELEASDLIVVLVKAYSTADLSPLAGLFTPDGAVLTLQNGLGNAEVLAGMFGEEKIAAGVTTYAAYSIAPGLVQAAGEGRVSLGPWKKGSDMKWVSDLLKKAGFKSEYADDPRPFLWRKLAINAMVNTTGALTGMNNGALRGNDYSVDLMHRLGREAVEAAGRAGVDLDFEEIWSFHMDNMKKTSANKCSMLQDREASRESEIDAISGQVLKYAGDDNDFPFTRTVYKLLKAIDTQRRRG